MTVVSYWYKGRRLMGVICSFVPKVGEIVNIKMRNWKQYKQLQVSTINFYLHQENTYDTYEIEVFLI